MFPRSLSRITALISLIAALALSGCGPYFQTIRTSGDAPTPVVSRIKGGIEYPNVFVDLAPFQSALLQALNAGDNEKLQGWMTTPILTGTWRTDLSETSPDEALTALFTEELDAERSLSLVAEANLKSLMGGKDPLSIPRSEAGVSYTFLVNGWGKDGRDEAILFVARQPDNSLKLHGWMVIKGGFSGARLDGLKPYTDEALGFSLYLPQNTDISTPVPSKVVFTAPGQSHVRGIVYIDVEPANGRTAEQVVEAIKTELGEGFNLNTTALAIEDAQALAVQGIPGQDSNIQLFMVHSDLLYHLTFTPDDPQSGLPFQQMQDLYAMIVNTFHFIR